MCVCAHVCVRVSTCVQGARARVQRGRARKYARLRTWAAVACAHAWAVGLQRTHASARRAQAEQADSTVMRRTCASAGRRVSCSRQLAPSLQMGLRIKISRSPNRPVRKETRRARCTMLSRVCHVVCCACATVARIGAPSCRCAWKYSDGAVDARGAGFSRCAGQNDKWSCRTIGHRRCGAHRRR